MVHNGIEKGLVDALKRSSGLSKNIKALPTTIVYYKHCSNFRLSCYKTILGF